MYTIKTIKGKKCLCSKNWSPGDVIWEFRPMRKTKRIKGILTLLNEWSVPSIKPLKFHYVVGVSKDTFDDICTELYTFAFHADSTDNGLERAYSTADSYCWKIEEIIENCNLEDDTQVESKEQLIKLMNPYPPIVEQFVEIMSKHGALWVDEVGEKHLDDVSLYETATDLYEVLKAGKIDFITNQLILDDKNEEAFRDIIEKEV